MTESRKIKIENEDVKVFKDLFEEIIHTGECCSCGSCVAYCESQAFDVIKMDDYTPKFKSPNKAENCTHCGVCYFICPQTDTILDKINEAHEVEDELGQMLDIIAAKTTEKAIEAVGQDGGIVTTLLTHLFDTHKIDAAIVSQVDDDFNTTPTIVFNKEDLLKSSGTRYSISSNVLPLKDLYEISMEIQEKTSIYDIEQLRVAFVGTPCQVRALSKMRFLNIKPSHVIKYVISLFCFENFDYEQLYEILTKETKIKPENIKKTWIKKNFFVQDKEDNIQEVGIKVLDPAVRSHCHKCDEFTGKYSDISVGASGAPKGHSMIITRTPKGKAAINSLISHNLIEQYLVPAEQAQEWREKKIKNFKRMISLKTK